MYHRCLLTPLALDQGVFAKAVHGTALLPLMLAKLPACYQQYVQEPFQRLTSSSDAQQLNLV